MEEDPAPNAIATSDSGLSESDNAVYYNGTSLLTAPLTTSNTIPDELGRGRFAQKSFTETRIFGRSWSLEALVGLSVGSTGPAAALDGYAGELSRVDDVSSVSAPKTLKPSARCGLSSAADGRKLRR